MGLVTPDFGLLFWMVLSFSIVLFLLGKYAWKPILKSLKDRENSIADALNSAEKAKEQMAQLQSDNEKLIQEARIERDRLIKEARQLKENIIKEAKKQAQVEASKMMQSAREAIQNEKAGALTEIKNQVADLSLSIAEKVLRSELADKGKQSKYIKTLLKDVSNN